MGHGRGDRPVKQLDGRIVVGNNQNLVAWLERLAYPIRKLSEGYYVLYNVELESGNPFPEVERRMEQNDKVLRYLTVRLDEGRLRERPDRNAAATAQAPSRAYPS